jgi:outer membrane receptor protein involved in Fe transport
MLGLVAFLAMASPVFGQAGRAEISGTVMDSANAVLPGATVTATNESTGLERTTVTTEEGRFIIPTLIPGIYTVVVELAGFQNTTRKALEVNVGQEVTLNLTMQLAGVAENITVTGQAALVETTTSRIGTNITNAEIDSLPAQGRNQLSLMQMVPGLVPSLSPGDFEGGQYNAAGQATSANVFLVDGAYNNDDRRGGSQGTQAAIALDAMAEYQVLTHQYSAEYGGGSGVVVNAVSRSGSNQISGRVFEYFKDDKLDAKDYFVKQEGLDKPDYGSNVFGGNVGGPIIRNRAFWFFNVERTLRKDGATLVFPASAAPLASSYTDTQDFTVLNTFLRTDFQVTSNNNLSVRWSRARELTEKDTLIGSEQVPSNFRYENDAGDQVLSVSFTSVIGNSITNELKVGHVREELLQGSLPLFDDNWNFIGLNGREQFDLGSQNTHPDYTAGPNTTFSKDPLRAYTIDNSLTYFRTGWAGDHTFKIGGGYSRNGTSDEGQSIGGNSNGTFSFGTNAAFDPANPRTYPRQFTIRNLGQLHYVQKDWRTNFYVQDKWQLNRQLTLNLGVRHDYQDIVPQTTDAWAPRLGIAYDPLGDGTTVIRAGGGKFYSIQGVSVVSTLLTGAIFSPVDQFDTGQLTGNNDPANSGVIPTHVCLQPTGSNGLAVISPACRAFLTDRRNQLGSAFVNRDPTVEGDRRIPYIWGYSAGVRRQLMSDLAVSVDYVGNVGRDQTTLIDINVGPAGADGRITRLGANGFDPAGDIVPLSNPTARAFNYRRVLQYKTDSRFNTDYNSLEVALEKRQSNRWSGRVSYTLAYANAVSAISDQLNPRGDYGRSNLDNRHALAASANFDVWRGLGAGFVFRAYSGYPINETIGSDVNGDNVNNDRPVEGIHDTAFAIRSELGAGGRAVPFGIDGEKMILLDSRFQYLWRFQQRYQAGLFLEMYNLTNRANFGNPTGARNSDEFMIPDEVGAGRSMQLGVRLTF